MHARNPHPLVEAPDLSRSWHPRARPWVRRLAAHGWAVLLILGIALALAEPASANKFETIGGGVSGSVEIKREWLQAFFLTLGGLSLLGSVLSLVLPHGNALLMNFRNWKQSAAVLAVFAVAFFGLAFLI